MGFEEERDSYTLKSYREPDRHTERDDCVIELADGEREENLYTTEYKELKGKIKKRKDQEKERTAISQQQ